jgi:hypothetical protein
MYTWEAENLVELQLPQNSWVGAWFEPGYERLFDHEFGATREARPCDPSGQDFNLPLTQRRPPCTFFGPSNERSSSKQHLSFYGGSNPGKKLSLNAQLTQRWGHFDLDFGNGSKYPRVSPFALELAAERSALEAAGQCDPKNPDRPAECTAAAPLDPGAGKLFQFNAGITYRPTNALSASFNINSQTLRRYDTDRYAYKLNIFTLRGTYQFTKATFARLILDYNTLDSHLRAQGLFGWTPSPGTAFYAGYNDDLNYDSLHPFRPQIVPGFRRNSRTIFIKMSYLIRRGF